MNIEEIRQQKLKQLQEQHLAQQQEAFKAQQQVDAIEAMAKQAMAPEAFARYSTLKTAHPEKALQAVAMIAQAASSGQVAGKVTDEQFKALLLRMEPEKKQTKINIIRR